MSAFNSARDAIQSALSDSYDEGGYVIPAWFVRHLAKEGFVVVPREPTEAMRNAGLDAFPQYGRETTVGDKVDEIYRAMLATIDMPIFEANGTGGK